MFLQSRGFLDMFHFEGEDHRHGSQQTCSSGNKTKVRNLQLFHIPSTSPALIGISLSLNISCKVGIFRTFCGTPQYIAPEVVSSAGLPDSSYNVKVGHSERSNLIELQHTVICLKLSEGVPQISISPPPC